MTALNDYIRLESTGLWRSASDAQRLNVYVFVRHASLVIANKAEEPLAHWSLPAIERLNPGQRPALFAPAPDATETLEIEDPDMIAAIETVQKAVRKSEPKPGRLRLWITGAVIVVIAGLALFWLPGAVQRHTLQVTPEAQRDRLGNQILEAMTRLTGAPCGASPGLDQLSRFAENLPGGADITVDVVRQGVAHSILLPGKRILLDRTVIEDHESADVAAGFILEELARAQVIDPLAPLLESLGPIGNLRLLATGEITGQALAEFAELTLRSKRPAPESSRLISYFEAARVPSSPYALALDPTGETTLELIEANPFPGGGTSPVLDDNAWVDLQSLCGG
jgi:hypothetical protein